ncbi:MAG: YqgE/AlgH family protein [Sphingomonadaceae bacterium]|nr:YqgE/AlgH family protein [Sphingomonadaceae bacterium]
MLDPRYLSGQLLLALPGIGDPRFERSVIAMCVHDDNGALGVIISALHDGLTARQLMEQLDIDPGCTPEDAPVYAGGPVEPGRGFVIHTQDYTTDGTIQVADVWSLSMSQQVLKDIASGRGPERWLLALGYAGWGERQLDGELRRHGWRSLDAAGLDDLIYDAPADQRWPRAFARLGVDVAHLAAAAGSA